MICDGIALFRAVLVPPLLTSCVSKVCLKYQELEAARHQTSPVAAIQLVGPGQRFVPTASSFTIGAALPDEDIRAVLAQVGASPADAWIKAALRGSVVCDVDQSWVRRQYPPSCAPPSHAPHGWHQDGALGFDFLAHQDKPFGSDALLPMTTCWITLDPCGTDAPGLEAVAQRFEGLLSPLELTEQSVRPRFAPERFWRPFLNPGDALLFRGDILHRTHVTPAMTKDRTSIELRFFPANNLLQRLKGDRFIPLY